LKKHIVKFASLMLALVMTASLIPLSASADEAETEKSEETEAAESTAEYPYPELLDYTALQTTFDELAAEKILPEYRDYIYNALTYHIESETDDYRVARNLVSADGKPFDGNVVFFFDGCSANLDSDTEITFSGYKKGDRRYNTSAVCIVVRTDDDGHPYVAFASQHASTMPDNVRNASLNGGTPPSITRDGIYDIIAWNHQGKYAALQIGTYAETGVRCSDYRKAYLDMATGINIHARSYSYHHITDNTRSSTGCFNIGTYKGDADYHGFMEAVTGMEYATGRQFTSTPTKYGVTSTMKVGITVVDRSNYKEALKTIYGDDKTEDGYKAEEIVNLITVGSDKWHEDITAPKFSADVVLILSGTSKVSNAEYEAELTAAQELASSLLGNRGTRLAVISLGKAPQVHKADENDSGFYNNETAVTKALESAEKPGGSAYAADAFAIAENLLSDSKADVKYVVVISDSASAQSTEIGQKYGTDGEYKSKHLNAAYNTAKVMTETGCEIVVIGCEVKDGSEKQQWNKDTAALGGYEYAELESYDMLADAFGVIAEAVDAAYAAAESAESEETAEDDAQ